MSAPAERAREIKRLGHALGFDLVGVAPAASPSETARLAEWVARGFAGGMRYLTSQVEARRDVRSVLPWARSVISLGLQYDTPLPYSTDHLDGAWISRYAWGDDYHDVMGAMLERLDGSLRDALGAFRSRRWVDAAPMIERAYAARAGLGWWGRNTCLIHPTHGSWFFLGEIVTDLDIAWDAPLPDRCGTCRACLDVCPTNALVEPYVLDARRCISYITIEQRGALPEEDRALAGRHVFGCDLCQDVCPWNRRRRHRGPVAFEPRPGAFAPDLAALSEAAQTDFAAAVGVSALRRARRRGLLRNVAVTLATLRVPRRHETLERLAQDTDDVVREHARWALTQIQISEEPGSR